MAWGIERVIAGRGGRPLDRHRAALERETRAVGPPGPGASGGLRYRLASNVPENWYPLLPQSAGLRAIQFELGQVDLAPTATPAPLGAVLGEVSAIEEEELDRPGLRVRRVARRMRWADGSVRLWLGHDAGVGTGESASGLRFDVVEPESETPLPGDRDVSTAFIYLRS